MFVGLLDPLSGTNIHFSPVRRTCSDKLQSQFLLAWRRELLTGPHWSHHPLLKTTYIQGLVGAKCKSTDLGFTARHLVRAIPGLELPMVPPETFTISSRSTSPPTHFCSPRSLQVFSLQANLQSESAVWGVPAGYTASLILGY